MSSPLMGLGGRTLAFTLPAWRIDADAQAKLIQKQAYKGAKGAVKRSGDNEDKQTSARLMAAKGMSVRAIAAELGVGKSSVARWTAD